jgi:hypothetical protein
LIHLDGAGRKAIEAVDRISPDGAFLLEEALHGLRYDLSLSYVAEFEVVETLLGSSPRATLDVRFDSWGPAVLPDERVIVFLRQERGSMRFLGYDNSIIYSRSASELDDVRSAVLAAADLRDRAGDALRMDWAVAAAGLPGSRLHVLQRLQLQELSDGQKHALAEGFVSLPSLNGLLELLAILQEFPHPAFDRRAAALVSATLSVADFPDSLSMSLVDSVLARWTTSGSPASGFCDNASQAVLWQSTVAALGLPPPGSVELSEVEDFQAMSQKLQDKLRSTYSQ